MPFPFIGKATLDNKQQVFNDLTDRERTADLKYAGHTFTGGYSFVGISSNRRNIVSKKHTIFLCSPCKDRWIVCAGEADILHSDDINTRVLSEQATNDIIV